MCKAINVVKGPNFRKWALYGCDNVTDAHLPHQTKLIELIHEAYEEENMKMIELLKVWVLYNCTCSLVTS
jgi:hypothetical protein